MDKFWQWMEEKRYGQMLSTGEDRTLGGYLLSKRMLIGYMIEYLFENDKLDFFDDIDKYYEYLKDKIKKLNET